MTSSILGVGAFLLALVALLMVLRSPVPLRQHANVILGSAAVILGTLHLVVPMPLALKHGLWVSTLPLSTLLL